MNDRCQQTVFGDRVQSWQCQRRAVVKRNGKAYCKQHDPDAVSARRRAADDAFRRKQKDEHALSDEADALARQLGVEGFVFFNHFQRCNARYLVISFEAARTLIQRLQSVSQD